MIRRIDDLGRVVIPRELRMDMKIVEGDALDIKMVNGVITINKVQNNCIYCNAEIKDSQDRYNPYLCDTCLSKLKSE